MARKKFAPPPSPRPDAGPGRFGILIRHPSFVDRIARDVPADYYYSSDEDINHWVGLDKHPALRFPTREAAQVEAARLAALLGGLNRFWYRFSVIEERPVPRWFLVEPEPGEREKIPVGSIEQP
jgi:hypothetical protein